MRASGRYPDARIFRVPSVLFQLTAPCGPPRVSYSLSTPPSEFGILSIFIILAAIVAAAVLAAAAIAVAIAGAIATLGTATIRYAACLIYEQLYNAFQVSAGDSR